MSQGVTVKIRRFLVQTPKTDLGEGAGGGGHVLPPSYYLQSLPFLAITFKQVMLVLASHSGNVIEYYS